MGNFNKEYKRMQNLGFAVDKVFPILLWSCCLSRYSGKICDLCNLPRLEDPASWSSNVYLFTRFTFSDATVQDNSLIQKWLTCKFLIGSISLWSHCILKHDDVSISKSIDLLNCFVFCIGCFLCDLAFCIKNYLQRVKLHIQVAELHFLLILYGEKVINIYHILCHSIAKEIG